MKKLTPYEKRQIKDIQAWKRQEPGVVNRAFGVAIEPLAWLVRKLIPESALRGALDFANDMGHRLADHGDIIRNAGVATLGELRTRDLKLSDDLADEIHNWSIGIAVAEGVATGAPGFFGVPFDIPAI